MVDYTDKKYFTEPDSLELTAHEVEELWELMALEGLAPSEIKDQIERKRYEKFLKNRVEVPT